MRIRAFVAIPLSPTIRKTLSETARLIAENACPGPDIRITPAKNLHVTVYFIGWIDGNNVDMIMKSVSEGVTGMSVFSLKNPQIMSMPSKNPRMIWCRFGQSEEYTTLASRVRNSVRKSGVTTDGSDGRSDKPDIPHATLIRCREIRSVLPPRKRNVTLIPEISVPVKECSLYRSILTSSGPLYEEIQHYSF